MAATKKNEKSIARAGFAEDVGAKKSHKTFTILPSKIRADHYADNHDRAALYSLAAELPELAEHPAFADDRFCFRRAEVLARAESFKSIGQEQAIKVYRSNTWAADVGAGFLRHAAALYLEVTGGLADCPGMRDGLLCLASEQPKDQLAAVNHNRGENERKETTAIDRAWLAKRYETLGKTRPEIAAALGIDKRSVDRLLQLLTLSPAVQLDIHEGRVTMMKALAEASAKGKGTARGSNGGVSRKAMRRRNGDERPDARLSPEQVDQLIDIINGDILAATVTDEKLRVWIDYVDAPAPPREPKASKKKPAPMPGKQVSQ